jgi:hypothetical protein
LILNSSQVTLQILNKINEKYVISHIIIDRFETSIDEIEFFKTSFDFKSIKVNSSFLVNHKESKKMKKQCEFVLDQIGKD